jgi:hypothetical protein
MSEGNEKIGGSDSLAKDALAAERRGRGMPTDPGDTALGDLTNAGKPIEIKRMPDGTLQGEILSTDDDAKVRGKNTPE